MSTPLGLMFPGQGSQSVGMLAELAASHPAVAETFAEASDALGEDLWEMAQQGPAERLDQTENTQPVLLAASVAIWRAWRAAGGRLPTVAAGHSLGEYSALVAAEALSLADAVRLVRVRGRLMQRAVPAGEGSMAAILGLDDAAVVACCEDAAADGIVAAANFNAPGQVVIAGDVAAIERAIKACRDAGAKRAMPLSVSVPSHCALMTPIVEEFAAELDQVAVQPPVFAVVQNVDAEMTREPEAIRRKLVAQLSAPVRWTDCVQTMAATGVQQLLECGPGKVLATMVKRIDRTLVVTQLSDPDLFAAAVERFSGGDA